MRAFPILTALVLVAALAVSGCGAPDNSKAAADKVTAAVENPLNLPGDVSSVTVDRVSFEGGLYEVHLSVVGSRSFHVTGFVDSGLHLVNFTEV